MRGYVYVRLVTLLSENFDQFFRFFVENGRELLQDAEVESRG